MSQQKTQAVKKAETFDKAQLILFGVVPTLDGIAEMLARRDDNSTGGDDLAASILHYGAEVLMAVLADEPMPEAPELLLSLKLEDKIEGEIFRPLFSANARMWLGFASGQLKRNGELLIRLDPNTEGKDDKTGRALLFVRRMVLALLGEGEMPDMAKPI